ncbi:hypothetical protein AGR1A_Cc40207 [Agrobacterium fabacearum CFBP 5771]|nr:hypothetical protein AGR1A_Cc40207 [Agrobacterium fabacearum CFBP 5771]
MIDSHSPCSGTDGVQGFPLTHLPVFSRRRAAGQETVQSIASASMRTHWAMRRCAVTH